MVDDFVLNMLQTGIFMGFGKTLCESFVPKQVYDDNHQFQAFLLEMKLLFSSFAAHSEAFFSTIRVPQAELK